MSFLHLSTGILHHTSFANCSRLFRFEGCLLPTAVLRSLHWCSMGFRSGLIAGLFRTLQHFVCNHSWVLFEVCFGSLSCWKTHDLWWRCSFLTLATYVAPQNYLVIIRFHDTVHTVKASSARSSKATPKHLWTSTMFDCRGCSFLWRPHFFFCKQCHDVLYQKALLLSHLSTVRSPRRIVVLSHKFVTNSSLAFLCAFCACLCVSSGVLLGLLP